MRAWILPLLLVGSAVGSSPSGDVGIESMSAGPPDYLRGIVRIQATIKSETPAPLQVTFEACMRSQTPPGYLGREVCAVTAPKKVEPKGRITTFVELYGICSTLEVNPWCGSILPTLPGRYVARGEVEIFQGFDTNPSNNTYTITFLFVPYVVLP